MFRLCSAVLVFPARFLQLAAGESSRTLSDNMAAMPTGNVDTMAQLTDVLNNGIASTILEIVFVLGGVLLLLCWNQRRDRQRGHHKVVPYGRMPTERGPRREPTRYSSKKHYSSTVTPSREQVAETTRLTDLMHASVKCGSVDDAVETLKRLADFKKPSSDDYKAVILLCVKQDPDLAHMVLRCAEDQHGNQVSCVHYNAVMNAYAKRGDAAQAVAIATRMVKAGVEFDTVSYNTLIDASARAGDADGAEAWMRQMLADGIKASVISFSSVMRACALAGRPRSVELWLEEADRLGIELNMISYSAIISAFAKCHDLTSATAWVTTMMSRGVSASVHCFTNILKTMVQQNEMQQAAQLVEKMKLLGVKLDAPIYNLLVSGAFSAGDVESAHCWASEAVANGIRLSRREKQMLMSSNWLPPYSANAQNLKPTQILPIAVDPENSGFDNAQAVVEICPTRERSPSEKRWEGTIKEFVASKFGYITCADTRRLYNRDVFLSSQDNPEGFAKGQRVSFRLGLDRVRGLPRAYDLRPVQLG